MIPDGYDHCRTGQVPLTCLECGAMVCDVLIHDSFHARLEGLEGR